MEVIERLTTVEDIWEMLCQPGGDETGRELIHGELIETPPADSVHAWLSSSLSFLLTAFVEPRNLGFILSEGGFSPPGDKTTLLAPDLAFVARERMPISFPMPFFGFMPDIAVEIMSSGNTWAELRRKADIYLAHGARLVWIINPMLRRAEVLRMGEGGEIISQVISMDGALSGEDALPGFVLEMRDLLPPESAGI